MFTAKFNTNFQSYLFTKYCKFTTVGEIKDNLFLETIEEELNEDELYKQRELELFIKIETLRCEGDYNMLTEWSKICEIIGAYVEEYTQMIENYKELLSDYRDISNEIQVKVLEEVKQMLIK